jgi:hypothetical protein
MHINGKQGKIPQRQAGGATSWAFSSTWALDWLRPAAVFIHGGNSATVLPNALSRSSAASMPRAPGGFARRLGLRRAVIAYHGFFFGPRVAYFVSSLTLPLSSNRRYERAASPISYPRWRAMIRTAVVLMMVVGVLSHTWTYENSALDSVRGYFRAFPVDAWLTLRYRSIHRATTFRAVPTPCTTRRYTANRMTRAEASPMKVLLPLLRCAFPYRKPSLLLQVITQTRVWP